MKKIMMSEQKPTEPKDYLTELGWLTFTGERWHYRNLPRHIINETSIEWWLTD